MDNNILLNLASDAISDRLNSTNTINKEQLSIKYPFLTQQAATFVTLTINGSLRGCIGALIAHRTLIDDIITNAQSAAFHDPRFPSLTKDEFSNTDIEISLLSSPTRVEFDSFDNLKEKIQIGIDGMIVKQGGKQATFLPQVWEQLPSFDTFMSHLFSKAGINDLTIPIEVFKYQVEKIK